MLAEGTRGARLPAITLAERLQDDDRAVVTADSCQSTPERAAPHMGSGSLCVFEGRNRS